MVPVADPFRPGTGGLAGVAADQVRRRTVRWIDRQHEDPVAVGPVLVRGAARLDQQTVEVEIGRVVLEQGLAALADVLELAGKGLIPRHRRETVHHPDAQGIPGFELQAHAPVGTGRRVSGERAAGQLLAGHARSRAASSRPVRTLVATDLVDPPGRLAGQREQSLLTGDDQDLQGAPGAGQDGQLGQRPGSGGRREEESRGGSRARRAPSEAFHSHTPVPVSRGDEPGCR